MAGTKGEGRFSLGNLLSAQFITQTEARPLLLCPPYLKKAYGSVEQYARGFVMRIKCYTTTISQSLLGNVVLFYFDS